LDEPDDSLPLPLPLSPDAGLVVSALSLRFEKSDAADPSRPLARPNDPADVGEADDEATELDGAPYCPCPLTGGATEGELVNTGVSAVGFGG